MQHVLDHVVVADAQAPWQDLGRQVAVAEMPGEAREVLAVGGCDLEHVLVRRMHRQPAAVLEAEPVALGERPRLRRDRAARARPDR